MGEQVIAFLPRGGRRPTCERSTGCVDVRRHVQLSYLPWDWENDTYLFFLLTLSELMFSIIISSSTLTICYAVRLVRYLDFLTFLCLTNYPHDSFVKSAGDCHCKWPVTIFHCTSFFEDLALALFQQPESLTLSLMMERNDSHANRH